MGLSRIIIICLLACHALGIAAQGSADEYDWYLDEVISESFIRQNDFDYYYQPSKNDIAQQRSKGELSYFLSTPTGLSGKTARDLIDQIMASYDDIQVMCDWQTTPTTYWKEFSYEHNKFRFSVKRKVLDDDTYYVSVTEYANHYKSLGKKDKAKENDKAEAKGKTEAISLPKEKAEKLSATDKPTKRGSRRKVELDTEDEDIPDPDAFLADNELVDLDDGQEGLDDGQEETTAMSEKERRRIEQQRKKERKQEERLAQKREQEQKRTEEKARKEAEKQRKAEEKRQKEEAKQREREEQKLRREQERQEREQRKRDEEAAAAKEAAAKKSAASKYHCSDVALWLSEIYDFTMTAGDETSCTMYSTAIKDVEMAKLAIKNALKGSNARMAVPWRLNSETQEVETGYTVDDHVLVFAIGKNSDGNITLTMTEVSAEQVDLFKQSLSTTNN